MELRNANRVWHHPIDQGRRWRHALTDPSPTNKTQKVQLLEGHKNLIFYEEFLYSSQAVYKYKCHR
jgi:hypothetical protein